MQQLESIGFGMIYLTTSQPLMGYVTQKFHSFANTIFSTFHCNYLFNYIAISCCNYFARICIACFIINTIIYRDE